MLYPLSARHVLAIGLAVSALSGAAAKADVYYTVTTTGTITSGTSAGNFGPSGTNLAGKAYTITETFDATLSDLLPGDAEIEQLDPATVSAQIRIGNTIVVVNQGESTRNAYTAQVDTGRSELTAWIDDTSGSLMETFITNTVVLLPSDSLSQMLFFAVPSSGILENEIAYNAPDGGTHFVATASTISLNGGTAVPEPRSVALLGVGLAGLAWLRRRKAA
jgi:hypothetical protein